LFGHDSVLVAPISQKYSKADAAIISFLRMRNQPWNVARGFSRLLTEPAYVKIQLPGASTDCFLRSSVVMKLQEALSYLPDAFGFLIYDGFRSTKTQLGLFDFIYQQQKALYPQKTHEELWKITRGFVAHPDDMGTWGVPPHNTGGAVDLTLTYNGVPLEMGTDFDEVSERSRTDFYESFTADEKEEHFRNNRRIFFNALKQVGFVNYPAEWWHYSLGDGRWAEAKGSSRIYDSMEDSQFL